MSKYLITTTKTKKVAEKKKKMPSDPGEKMNADPDPQPSLFFQLSG